MQPRQDSAPRTGTRRAGRLLAFVAALVVLVPAVASALPVEDYASYEPQTNCSPNAKPGTLKLSQWLQKQYPGSGSLGISRSCNDGGVSEHKEGRAFDWAVDVSSARDRAYVNDFFAKIFATDAEGNRAALARRMGIMYLIWNDHIYSSYYGFTARDYKGCKVLSTCSATLRHRNHVHISLSRAGGNGLTSWYGGTAAAPAVPLIPTTASGVLDLSRRPFVTFTTRVDGRGRTTGFKLRRGTAYKVTATGVYGFGRPNQVADASCRWSSGTRWVPSPTRTDLRRHGSLNLLVNGRAFGQTCRAGHVYNMIVKPRRTGAMRLRVANTPTGASGNLTVIVSRRGTNVSTAILKAPLTTPAPTTTDVRTGTPLTDETVAVPASSDRVWSVGSVEKGASYRLTVSGTAALGGGASTDGRCVSSAGAWFSRASLDRWFPGNDHGKLYVDGTPFTGAASGGGAVCGSRSHVMTWTATRTGLLELAIHDPFARTDNTGEVVVALQRLTPLPVAARAAAVAPVPASAPTTSTPVPAEPSPKETVEPGTADGSADPVDVADEH